MIIVYKNEHTFKVGNVREFNDISKLDPTKKWFIGIDGSSTSYGLAIYTKDFQHVNLFMFVRESMDTIDSFRETMYSWFQNFMYGIPVEAITYEKTPEGYKPPTSHAEKVMRDTETAIRNFVKDRNYLYVRNKDYIFDIFPNAWKFFSVPKDRSNLGKVDKELNALSVITSCGLDPDYWFKEINRLTLNHSFDCFEALGIGRYGSHFILTDEGEVTIYKNFTKVGTQLVACGRIESAESMGELANFIGRFGAGRQPRMCVINPNHSLPENFMGLYDKEFNNILVVNKEHPYSVYIDMTFNFDSEDKRDYIIVGTKASKTDLGVKTCTDHGFSPVYI